MSSTEPPVRNSRGDGNEFTPPTPEELEALRRDARLSMPPAIRFPIMTSIAFAVGMSLGIMQGGNMAGLRFRAEHAHKLPTTTTGWFMYHKSKNYNIAFGGLTEGLKMGLRVSVPAASILSLEFMFDEYRGTKDFINTTIASVTVAGALSSWNRFSLPMAARTTKTAILAGLIYGGLQDGVGALRGRPIGYIDFVKHQLSRSKPATSGESESKST